MCTTRRQAHAALAELPGPVAVKLLDAAIMHKSDAGGVFLGVRDSAELDRALDGLEAAGHDRFLVESMAPPGRGPAGRCVPRPGVRARSSRWAWAAWLAEALADVAVALAPLTATEAAELPAELAGRALLDGFRGGPVADRAALGDVLARLGGLLAAPTSWTSRSTRSG